MDITELLKKIESGETTASDAQWLHGLMDENDLLWKMMGERHAAIRKASKHLLDIIEELGEYRLTGLTFTNKDRTNCPERAKAAIQQLKDALESK